MMPEGGRLGCWRRLSGLPVLALLFSFCFSSFLKVYGAENRVERFVGAVNELLAPVQKRKADPFTLSIRVNAPGIKERKLESGAVVPAVRLVRKANDHFAILVRVNDVQVDLVRTPETCYLWLPNKGTFLVSKGPLPEKSELLTLDYFWKSVRCIDPAVSAYGRLVSSLDASVLLPALKAMGYGFKFTSAKDNSVVQLIQNGKERAAIALQPGKSRVRAVAFTMGTASCILAPTLEWDAQLPAIPDDTLVKKRVEVERAEFERALLRGFVRALEIQWEDVNWIPPADRDVAGEHGWYKIRDGRRIVKLTGNAQEIGLQHGRFLKRDVRRMVDSTLYVVGTIYSVERGRWFLDEIRGATARLEKHMPSDQIEELKALAEGSGVPYEELRLAGYFPELFHCSGFALSGKATVGGKLLHGRILDYMTEIGLQRTAVLFVVAKKGRIPFVNVGYAGFVGSVSGMNRKKISLGEMGGEGEGKWDGMPMASLMRLALETCGTLEETKKLFRETPRTCEYYYVFADGKDRSAVGVCATPEKIEFLGMGEAHPQLPNPQEDCVLLSAGKRYGLLCQRVKENAGQIDEAKAIRIMDAPVAMGNSNLHSVLFVPEDLVLHVSHAGRNGPAYKEQYIRYALEDLLKEEAASPGEAEK